MTKQLTIGFCVVAASLASVTAAETIKGDPGKTLADSSSSAMQKVEAIQTYVAHVEKSLASYTRKEETIAADSLKNVTDESWQKMHGYFEGETLKRMKLYPVQGSEKTEEFYFYNNDPVFVFVEKNGVGKEGHDKDAVGSKYYFADGKLIAATAPDGKSMDIASDEAGKMSAKLQKESTAFRGMLK